MNLDKAKEQLDNLALPGQVYLNKDDIHAIKLGIEAMKRIQHQRTLSTSSFQPLLKGETLGQF